MVLFKEILAPLVVTKPPFTIAIPTKAEFFFSTTLKPLATLPFHRRHGVRDKETLPQLQHEGRCAPIILFRDG